MIRRKAIVEMDNVSFRYNDSAEQLKGVNLSIYEGECVVVTGVSGSGKTTLTRIVNGLIPNFYEGKLSGSVRLKQIDAQHMASWDFGRIVGSVFQDSRSQFFTSVVEEEIAFSGENYGMDPASIRERVILLAEDNRLSHLLKQEVHRLSSGEKQKVAVASACFTDPELLVMDEPSANLDMEAALRLSDRLAALKAKGKTIIVAEHRLYYLLPVADRILYMRGGEIAAEWTPGELAALPPDKWAEYGLRAPVLQASIPHAHPAGGAWQERLALSNVSIAPGPYKTNVMEHVNFSLKRGEIVAITGPNGAGKTTLARTLCGLLKERAGTIAIDGKAMKAKDRLSRLWFVMQDSDYQLFSDSVRNELMLTHEKEPDANERAENLLKALDMWELRDRHPATLSGGQKQRLAFAVGLMNRPDILILDEPTSGLDGSNMLRVVKLIRKIADSGVAVLVITHDHELLFAACSRMLYFQGNRLEAELAVEAGNRAEMMRCMLMTTPSRMSSSVVKLTE